MNHTPVLNPVSTVLRTSRVAPPWPVFHVEPSPSTGFELFGFGWRPPMPNDYVGRHRAPDA